MFGRLSHYEEKTGFKCEHGKFGLQTNYELDNGISMEKISLQIITLGSVIGITFTMSVIYIFIFIILYLYL